MSASLLAERLVAARRRFVAAGLPADWRPSTAAEADRVQDTVASLLRPTDGPVVAWKVGAASPAAEPSAAPIHAASLFAGAPGPDRARLRLIGAEAELAYRLDRVPRLDADGTCTIEAIADAIGSVHVAIEILDTRFGAIPDDPLLARADQANHGALIVGPGLRDWRRIVPVETAVVLAIDGQAAVSRVGGNNAGDPLRLLAWLAGHAASRGMPLHAGSVVTTGSTTGTLFVGPDAAIEARFEGVGALLI